MEIRGYKIEPNADLSGADLSDQNLHKADLSGANLYGANLEGANLYNADLSGAILSGADLGYADLRYAILSGADLGCADERSRGLSVGAWKRARGLIKVGLTSDDYEVFTVSYGDHVKIKAGCRWFTLPEAREHWTKTRGDTFLGKERLMLVEEAVTLSESVFGHPAAKAVSTTAGERNEK